MEQQTTGLSECNHSYLIVCLQNIYSLHVCMINRDGLQLVIVWVQMQVSVHS